MESDGDRGEARIIRCEPETPLNSVHFPLSRFRERAGVRAILWKRFARLPSPYPLPQAGEGKSRHQSDGGGGARTVRFPFVSGGVTMPCCSMTSISRAARL